jgi:hypothetical protein
LASDADTDALVTYTLDDDAGGRFAIDSSTGVVTVASALDYESATSHSITVRATSSDGSSNTGTYTIDVTNIDELPPQLDLDNSDDLEAQSTTITFASSYDVGDVVSLIVDGKTYIHTVVTGATSAENVYDALKLVNVDGTTLANSLTAEGVSWAANLSSNAVTLTGSAGATFTVDSAISNAAARPWIYTVDFDGIDLGSFNSGGESITLTINGTDISATNSQSGAGSLFFSWDKFDRTADYLADIIVGSNGITAARYDDHTNTFTITTNASSIISGESTSNDEGPKAAVLVQEGSSPQSTTITFASSYDVGDAVSLIIDGKTYTHTVVTGATSAESVYDALKGKTPTEGGSTTLANSLTTKGVSWASDLNSNAVTLTANVGTTFTVDSAISNTATQPYVYTVDFSNDIDDFDDDNDEYIRLTIDGEDYTAYSKSAYDEDNSGFDRVADDLVEIINQLSGITAKYDDTNNTFTITSSTSKTISGKSTSDDKSGDVHASRGGISSQSKPSISTTAAIGLSGSTQEAPAIQTSYAEISLTGYETTFTEVAGPDTRANAVAIVNTDISIIDLDSTTLYGAVITITNLKDGVAEALSINGTLPAGITAFAYDAANGTLTLTGTASKADYEAALKLVRYNNSSDNPNTTARTIAITVNDGDIDSNTAVATVTITGTNDAPTFAQASVVASVPENSTAVGTFTASDVDAGTTLTYSLGGTNASLFTINQATGVVSFKVAPNYEVDARSYSINVIATDGGALTATQAVTVNVTDVNDAPVAINDTLAATEDTAVTYTAAQLTGNDSDADGNPLTIASVTNGSNGTVVLNGNGTVTFTPTANFNGVANFTYTVSDGTANSSAATATVNVAAVNDAPVVTPSLTPLTYTENGSATAINALFAVTDVDSANLSSATVTISAGLTAGDLLAVSTQNGISGTYNSGTGVLTLTGSATVAHYQAALRSVTYASTSDNPTASSASRTISWAVNDGAGANAASNTGTSTISINAVNDIPTLTTMAAVVQTVNEDTQTTISFANLAAQGNEADVDGTVTAFIVKAVSSGTLLIGTTAGTATAFNATTNCTIDASKNAYWTPALNANGAAINAFTVVAQDNSGAQSASAIQAQVSVTAVNYAPNVVDITVDKNENIAAGTSIINISDSFTGTDFDRDGTAISYSITSGNTDSVFAINSGTGVITIAAGKSLDYEATSSYTLVVRASDGINSDNAIITVNVNDLNNVETANNSRTTYTATSESDVYDFSADDSSTVAAFDTISSFNKGNDKLYLGSALIPTNLASGNGGNIGSGSDTVRTHKITDGIITFSNTDFIFIGQLSINNSTRLNNVITYLRSLSLEDGGAVAFVASGTGIAGTYVYQQIGTANIDKLIFLSGVTGVSDINDLVTSVIDRAPNIIDTAVSLNENVAAGTTVTNISDSFTSTDLDRDGNVITYSITSGNSAGIFAINGATGLITIAAGKTLDYEATSSYALIVTASDGTYSDTANITVNVNNRDEVAPTISSGATASAINENVATGAVVYTTTTTDTGDISNGVTYSLKAATGDVAKFTINGITGAVTLNESPNYENKQSYTFTVIATDTAGNAAEQEVSLAVNNFNEIAGNNNSTTLTGTANRDYIDGLDGNDTISGLAGDDWLIGGAGSGNDIITGGTGADLLTGGSGNDRFIFATGDSTVTIGGSGDNGTISGFDIISDYSNGDTIDLNGTPSVRANITSSTSGNPGNGTNTLSLTIGGLPVTTHTVSNGIITFYSGDAYINSLTIQSWSAVAAVTDYLRTNDFGNAGVSVAFTGTINAVAHTFVYNQITTNPGGELIALQGVTLTSLATSNPNTNVGFISPIALDLNNDGVSYLSQDAGVAFDYNNDGVAESTAWVAPEDGLLANQRADGSLNIVFSTQAGETDLEGLAKVYDTNFDAVFDSRDTGFTEFGVWQDANSDGIVQEGEFRTLADRGIVSLSLASDGVIRAAANGDVLIFGQTTYTMTDGSTGIADDVAFAVSSVVTDSNGVQGIYPIASVSETTVAIDGISIVDDERVDLSAILNPPDHAASNMQISQDAQSESPSTITLNIGGVDYEVSSIYGKEVGNTDVMASYDNAMPLGGSLQGSSWTDVVDMNSQNGGPASISTIDQGQLTNQYANEAGDWTIQIKSGIATVDAANKQINFTSDQGDNSAVITTGDGTTHEIMNIDKIIWH